MPGHLHQAFVALLRRRECALELARIVGVPDHPAELWEDVDAECPDPAGRGVLYHADLAMIAFGPDGKALAGMLFEPQLGIDPSKDLAWPIYWVTLRTRHCCPVWEIVVSPDDGVVRWANRLFRGEPQVPFVIGRDQVPPVLDLTRALANPALAAFAAALHAHGPHARAAAEIVIQACVSLPAEDRRCYLEAVFAGLEEDIVNAIKPSIPESLKWEMTEYERRGAWFQNGLREGREEGELAGKRDVLLRMIQKRGLALTDEQRSTIEACSDEAKLDRWIDRIFDAPTSQALLAP
jgi:hypothetical protein